MIELLWIGIGIVIGFAIAGILVDMTSKSETTRLSRRDRLINEGGYNPCPEGGVHPPKTPPPGPPPKYDQRQAELYWWIERMI